MSFKVTEPVKDFREVFKDYDPSEIERITEVLGALSVTEGEVTSWKQDMSGNVIEPHCICGTITGVGVVKIGTNPSFPESIYVEVYSSHAKRKEDPNLMWFRGRMVDSHICFDEGAVLFQHEYIGSMLRPIMHLDAEQLNGGNKPTILHNYKTTTPLVLPSELEGITLKTAGEVFFGVARKILNKE